MSDVYTIKIAGPAGLGIKTSGLLLSKILVAHGFNTHDFIEYPSLIRGGHNTFQVSFSTEKVEFSYFYLGLFFSLSSGHWQQHIKNFKKEALVFGDEEAKEELTNGKFLRLPLTSMVKEIGNAIVGNTICLGVAAFIFGLDKNLCEEVIKEFFGDKSELNLKAFSLGFNYASKNYASYKKAVKLPDKKNTEMGVYDGNEAFGWGFIKGKGDFYAAYPMTPSSGTLHFLAEKQREFKIVVRHPEDEISVANMASGAAFAGARAAVGTSGGGFALMNEAVSWCGMAEIGMVYYLVSREAPATGLPTWTAQGDLLYSIFSGHGEFTKVVLAPGDQEESFEFSVKALNLADNLQTPIIVLSDKEIAESTASINKLEKREVEVDRGWISAKVTDNFKRYDVSDPSGRSYRTLPGTVGGEFLANSYEHDEYGFSTEDSEMVTKMAQKRMRKLKTAIELTPRPVLFGSQQPRLLVVSWGSNKGGILEALKFLKREDIGFLQIRTMWPLHDEIEQIVKRAEKVVVVETNQTSQLTTLFKMKFDFKPTKQFLKFDGRPFFPEELYERLKSF